MSRPISIFQFLLIPFYILYKLAFGFVFFFLLALFYPLYYFLIYIKKDFATTFVVKRFFALLMQVFLLIPNRTEISEDELPEPPYIICPNHTSYLDIILTYRIIPDYFVFMGKHELLSWPLFNIFFKSGMDIAVNRASPVGASRAMSKAREMIEQGHSIAIFPEGTIPPHVPQLKRFKSGAFKLAIETGVPIVPVTFHTNYKILSDPAEVTSRALPGIASITIHKPIETKGKTQQDLISLRDEVYDIIDASLKGKA